jgi:hypothetical protein
MNGGTVQPIVMERGGLGGTGTRCIEYQQLTPPQRRPASSAFTSAEPAAERCEPFNVYPSPTKGRQASVRLRRYDPPQVTMHKAR